MPAGPEVEALELASEVNIPIVAAIELLDGMLDQQPTAVKDEAELLRYCHAAAGTVGFDDAEFSTVLRADHFAIDLGIASS